MILQISEEQILRVPEHKAGESFPCLPTLCFVVTNNKNDHLLAQWIHVQGAVVVDGSAPSFLISSTPPPPIMKSNLHVSDYYSTPCTVNKHNESTVGADASVDVSKLHNINILLILIFCIWLY